VQPRRGLRLPWTSRFVRSDGLVAADAKVDLVLVGIGNGGSQRRLLRHFPADLATAVEALGRGPLLL
jgi:acyl-CoA thioester hydrolase